MSAREIPQTQTLIAALADPRYGSRPAGGSSSSSKNSSSSSASTTVVGDDASTMAATVFTGGRSSSVCSFNTVYTTSEATASDDGHHHHQYLVCEFCDLLGCARTFGARDVEGWVAHVAGHLGGRFPAKSLCWFCNDVVFNAGDAGDAGRSSSRRRTRFEERLRHVAGHQLRDGYTYEHMRPDFFLIRHLREHAIIDDDTFARCMGYTELPDELRRMRQAGADKPASSPRTSTRKTDRGGLVFDQAREDRLRRKEERENKKKIKK